VLEILQLEVWEEAMSPKRVLVIDDEDAVREIVQSCFEDIAGWEVITANSGQEGLTKALAEIPEAIVLDVMMPGMDGIALLRKLQTYPTARSIPVVLLTAKDGLTNPIALSSLGVVGIIAKPFDPLELANQVARLLAGL
jgi:CheY-like chemotaxis protein